jgi:hypothetical protein
MLFGTQGKAGWETACDGAQTDKASEWTVGDGAAGSKTKTTQHAGGQCVSEKSQDTTADMDEARADGDDDNEVGNSEDEDGEYEDGEGSAGDRTASHSKRRQARSFYFTRGAVKRIQVKEDDSLSSITLPG